MFRAVNALLKNLSMTHKLILGYGLVLALMLIMALISTQSISEIVERSEQVSTLDDLDLQVYRLARAQTAYLSNGDDVSLNELRTELSTLKSLQTDLAKDFTDANDAAQIEQQRAQTEAYQATLDELVPVYVTRAAEHANLVRLGASMIKLMASAKDIVMADTYGDNAQRLAERDAFGNMIQKALETRLVVLNFVLANLKSQEQAAKASVDHVLQQINDVRQAVSYNAALLDSLDPLEQEVQRYKETLGRYSAAVDQATLLDAKMAERSAAIINLSQQLSQAQLDKRNAQTTSTYQTLALSTVAALVIGMIAATLISRQIVRPLKQLVVASEQIASGDLGVEIRVNRHDEIGHLQQSMQRMAQSLSDLIRNIHQSVGHIAKAAEELSAVTEQTNAGVNSQKVETDQVATAMNEMVATVQEVARNAEHASESADAADRQSHEGELAIQEAIQQMDRLAQEVVRSNEAVQSLNQESQKIGSVLDVIKAVADQTNLLALNAAIEAARAGDAGRGFAVVADEVRGLAQHTQKSAEEIEALISGLQRESTQASQLMQSSQQLTATTLELSRDAGVRLAGIVQAVSHIQAMNQQIAAAAEQQGSVAEEINRSVVSVRDVSEQTSEASKKTSDSSVELARLGTELRQLVSRFKV